MTPDGLAFLHYFLAELLVPERDRQRWHLALREAHWSVVVAWRERLQVAGLTKNTAAIEALLTPDFLVHMTESLHRERLIRRGTATRVQEAILRQTSAHGQWVELALPIEAGGTGGQP
jgi:hypothetical protein